jgi:DNA-binding beta-propeller fold protein YncE
MRPRPLAAPSPRTALVLSLLALAALVLLALRPGGPDPALGQGGADEVIFVGNNWDGTASVLDPANGYEEVARINTVPDREQREFEIQTNPVDYVFFLAIRQFVGEGNDQLVDDMYTTPDGQLLIVSRPSYRDVVALDIGDCEDLASCDIAWRFQVDGNRSDHMAISPDGSEVAVSASTGNVVHILDTQTGQEIDSFPSGDSPHENTYSEDGERLYHASIGRVYVPLQDGGEFPINTLKGERVFRVVDTDGYEIRKDIDLGKKLTRAGYGDLSRAVRPMAISRNERKAYFQVSFFHGFLVYDFERNQVTRKVDLPNLVPEMPKEQYLLNSAHHGIALNGKGTRLCVAGTMSDYAAIVNRRSLGRRNGPNFRLLKEGKKAYWSTTSADGKSCYVSWSGTDRVSVFSYAKRRQVAKVRVGDHPQRVRTGYVEPGWIESHSE